MLAEKLRIEIMFSLRFSWVIDDSHHQSIGYNMRKPETIVVNQVKILSSVHLFIVC